MLVMLASLERNLSEERKIVSEAIFGQGGIPTGLAYPSVPENYIHKLNLQCLDDSNYVLLLIGSEYGALSERGISYLHAVYASAQAKRKPVISLVYQGDNKPSFDMFDQKRLSGFVDLLKSQAIYYWSDDISLRDAAERALEDTFEAYPSEGWVRAGHESSGSENSVVDKLKDQISQLSRRLANQRPKTDVKSADEVFKDCDSLMLKYQCNAFREGRLRQLDDAIRIEYAQLFENVSVSLLTPSPESKVRTAISNPLMKDVLAKAQSAWPGCHAVSDIKIESDTFDRIKLKFKQLHLIQFDTNGRWQLTQDGEQLLMSMKGE